MFLGVISRRLSQISDNFLRSGLKNLVLGALY